MLNYTSRVRISRYDATLRFESHGVDDSGDYQCLVSNVNGTDQSSVASVVVLGEWRVWGSVLELSNLFCVRVSRIHLFQQCLHCVS